jgi:hypothetical protein
VGGQAAHAAGGGLDPKFGNAGQVMTDFANSTDIAHAVALQAEFALARYLGKRPAEPSDPE